MKNIFIIFYLLLLCSCQIISHQNTIHSTRLENISNKDSSSDIQILQKFTWSFTSDSNSVPILVNFSNQDLYLYSGCNQISKRIEIHHNHLKSKGQQIQTLMGCGLLQAQEELATRIFNDSKLEIHSNKINQKNLKVVLKDGSSYTFLGITLIPDLKNYHSELLKNLHGNKSQTMAHIHYYSTSSLIECRFLAVVIA